MRCWSHGYQTGLAGGGRSWHDSGARKAEGPQSARTAPHPPFMKIILFQQSLVASSGQSHKLFSDSSQNRRKTSILSVTLCGVGRKKFSLPKVTQKVILPPRPFQMNSHSKPRPDDLLNRAGDSQPPPLLSFLFVINYCF